MTTGEKIAKFRRENNYTQEQLAELLSVSRQSISKYESDLTLPDTDKLVRLSELFHCSVDYLLKDYMEEDCLNQEEQRSTKQDSYNDSATVEQLFRGWHVEKKSKQTVFGVPLWHVGKNAKGIIAVGLRARGIISVGLFSTGIISFGLLSIGLFAFGVLALGLLTAGCISIGVMSTGAISIGFVACGAVAIGRVAIGAAANGYYIAYGDYARGMFAFGDTKAVGSCFEKAGRLSPAEVSAAVEQMKAKVPECYQWIVNWLQEIL